MGDPFSEGIRNRLFEICGNIYAPRADKGQGRAGTRQALVLVALESQPRVRDLDVRRQGIRVVLRSMKSSSSRPEPLPKFLPK